MDHPLKTHQQEEADYWLFRAEEHYRATQRAYLEALTTLGKAKFEKSAADAEADLQRQRDGVMSDGIVSA